MARSSKKVKKKPSRSPSPPKKQAKSTSKKRVTALGRHMEQVKAKE